ncbi:LAME_0H20406g1_1 [Lachancea meyersii CBS 8951]|uniref:LAME_0H20406g1_1 n=1 Tax=Lachancea meyersii CBS 8951 TaxID=1266667 RepID=A0A1G4KJM0_9SACH|nr:LAME_0H20406g1_1 [Lachancea meyersii CBS 8951]
MSKRAAEESNSGTKKKYRFSTGILEPCVSGVYATCSRKREKQAAQELANLFQEKLEEYYGDDALNNNEDTELDKELSVEEQINKELETLKAQKSDPKNKEILRFVDLNCECVVFCKTRKPVVPETFVHKIMKEFADPNVKHKRTRYIQKLTPVTFSCNASLPELTKLAQQVLKPHFHEEGIRPLKFAVEVTRRNFNTIEKMDIINAIVREVGKDSEVAHTVDLKKYDKLVLVECFKNNIGMSVVDSDYRDELKKYNVQQVFEVKIAKNSEDNHKGSPTKK